MGAPEWRERRRFRLPLGGRARPRSSTRDDLTGFLHPGAFQAVGAHALRRAHGLDEPTGVVCVVLNEEPAARPGRHELGLRRVASVLRRHVRGEDVLGRTADNELCALLPGVGEADTEEVARRIEGAFNDSAGAGVDGARLGIGWAVVESYGLGLEDELSELVRRARQSAS